MNEWFVLHVYHSGQNKTFSALTAVKLCSGCLRHLSLKTNLSKKQLFFWICIAIFLANGADSKKSGFLDFCYNPGINVSLINMTLTCQCHWPLHLLILNPYNLPFIFPLSHLLFICHLLDVNKTLSVLCVCSAVSVLSFGESNMFKRLLTDLWLCHRWGGRKPRQLLLAPWYRPQWCL